MHDVAQDALASDDVDQGLADIADMNTPRTLEDLRESMANANTHTGQTLIDSAGHEYSIWERPDGTTYTEPRSNQSTSYNNTENTSQQPPRITLEELKRRLENATPIEFPTRPRPNTPHSEQRPQPIPRPDTSQPTTPENNPKKPIENVASAALNNLLTEHHINPTDAPDLQNALFVGSRPQMEQALASMGINVEGGLPPAAVMTTSQEPGTRNIEQMLWLDENHPYIASLKNPNANADSRQQGELIIDEEVSHLLYKDQYFKNHGEEPAEWMTEMIGAMDKYNLFQQKAMETTGRPLTAGEAHTTSEMIFTALNIPGMPAHHEGHKLAIEATNYINNLYNTGRQQEAGTLFDQLYKANENQMRALLQRMRS